MTSTPSGPEDPTLARAPGLPPTPSRSRPRPAPALVIREMRLEDLPAVYALGEQLFRPEENPTLYRTWDDHDLVALYGSDGEYCLVAELEDRLVGFVLGSIIEKRRSAWSYGYLEWIGVHPATEGKGIARRLMARLTDLFIEAGARMMLVDTEMENERALAFFRRAGFASPVEHVYLSRNLTLLPGYQRHRDSEGRGRSGGANGRPGPASNRARSSSGAPRDDEHPS